MSFELDCRPKICILASVASRMKTKSSSAWSFEEKRRPSQLHFFFPSSSLGDAMKTEHGQPWYVLLFLNDSEDQRGEDTSVFEALCRASSEASRSSASESNKKRTENLVLYKYSRSSGTAHRTHTHTRTSTDLTMTKAIRNDNTSNTSASSTEVGRTQR